MSDSSNQRSESSEWIVGWDEVELANLKEFARWTFEEKVDWLEESQRVAEMFANARASATRVGDGAPLNRVE